LLRRFVCSNAGIRVAIAAAIRLFKYGYAGGDFTGIDEVGVAATDSAVL
jgi:hypothetical protein